MAIARRAVLAGALAVLPLRGLAQDLCERPAGGNDSARTVVDLTNALRRGRGLAPLSVDPMLTDAAQRHACFMAATRRMTHDGANGSDPGDRAAAAGYPWRNIAENVAMGQRSAGQVVTSWRDSKGHRRNMLNRDLRDIGIGIAAAEGVPYWVMLLGAVR